ncbi:hypothetical protein HAX54_020432 [Datura stramonium]|uniref:Transmembrane protein n=1 Tax=Datura stramonium TaxID=4076 RepID=A0ABS8URW5_DATST|nr:hypothetical protein [Datura stramonium]
MMMGVVGAVAVDDGWLYVVVMAGWVLVVELSDSGGRSGGGGGMRWSSEMRWLAMVMVVEVVGSGGD